MTLPAASYWLPHSSSVDFCEPNYLLTHMAVEPWNASSSLFFSLFGIIGILYSNPMKERRVTMLYVLLIIIGLGSFALHASLHWFAQSLDELPMLWFNVYVLYFLCTLGSPPAQSVMNSMTMSTHDGCDIENQKPNYIGRSNFIGSFLCIQKYTDKEIGAALSSFAVGVTFVYYNLQSYYVVFVAGYIFTVVAVFVWTVALIYLSPSGKSSEEGGWIISWKLFPSSTFVPGNTTAISTLSVHQKFNRMTLMSKTCLQGVVLAFGAIGFSCWLLDMHLCPGLLPFYTSYSSGMTLHVIWHMGAAYGGYLHVQTLILLRARALGIDLHIHEGNDSSVNRPMILSFFCLPILCDQKTLQKSSSSVEITCQQPEMFSWNSHCSEAMSTTTSSNM